MKSLKNKYKLSCPWGVLVIHSDENTQPHCSLFSSNGSIIYQQVTPTPFQLPLPFTNQREAEQFMECIGEKLDRIIQAVSQVRIRQSCILRFCIYGGIPAMELLEDCPALALLLALKTDYISSIREYQRQIVDVVNRNRRKILHYCSFPSSKWVHGLLRKIPAAQSSPYILDDLKKILVRNKPDQIKILLHLKHVNGFVIGVMSDPDQARLVEPSFYSSTDADPETDSYIEVEYLMREIQRLSIATAITGDRFKAPRIRTVRDLDRVHDLYVQRYHAQFSDTYCINLMFPNPPIPEFARKKEGQEHGIYPLKTGKALYREGVKMIHCIASYGPAIAEENNLYAYHVSMPDKDDATVLIEKSDERWCLFEIRGFANQDVSAETEYFVQDWLNGWNERHHVQ